MAAGPLGTHAYATGVNVHTALRAIYADAAARTAEASFYDEDINKFVLQLDTGALWRSVTVTAGVPTWAAVTSGSTTTTKRNIVPTGAVNGTNVTFVLPDTPANGCSFYMGGLRQNPGAGNDYTISGPTITMAVAPNIGPPLADYEV